MIWWKILRFNRESWEWETIGCIRHDYYSRKAVMEEARKRKRLLARMLGYSCDCAVLFWES